MPHPDPTTSVVALLKLRPGHAGIVERFTSERLACKLLDIGVVPGSRIQLIRKAPFGGGWYVKVDRQCIALRKQELACIVMK
ncbi:MAG: FeoA family protein [Saprospiraceae bacterium]